MTIRKQLIYRKSNKSKKTRSNRGGNPVKKLAILFITTHGNLDAIEEETVHDIDINVYKINATRPGVCNFINDDELVTMGKSISTIVQERKYDWNEQGRIIPASTIELSFKTPGIANQQINYLTQRIRSHLQKKDPIHKESFKAKSASKPISESEFFDESEEDRDIDIYRDRIGEGYKQINWKMGDRYMNKQYTIVPSERVETGANPYNNSITIIGDDGMPEVDLKQEMRHNLRSITKREDNYEFTMKDILSKLKDMGYTDTIIIDLSCAAGIDDRHGRQLRRDDTGRVYGGKRIRKNKTKKRKSKRKNTRKNTRKNKRH